MAFLDQIYSQCLVPLLFGILVLIAMLLLDSEAMFSTRVLIDLRINAYGQMYCAAGDPEMWFLFRDEWHAKWEAPAPGIGPSSQL